MLESFRVRDMIAEKEIARFLDKNLYSRAEFSDFFRFTNKDDQLKGKDVSFSLAKLKKIIVDEKAQVYYVNKNIPTFAFEIDFIRAGKVLTQGWLFDSEKETQYYLLIWINADKAKDFKSEDITKLECLLLKREDIILFLYEQGLTKEICGEISREIRKSCTGGKHQGGEFEDCYFYFSPHLAEAPINIVIRKDRLKELATRTFDVNHSGQNRLE